MSISITAALGDAGAAPSFEHAGRTWRAALLTQGAKSEFERRLVARALGALAQMREHLPPEEYAADKAELLREVKTGEYAFHGPVAQRALATTDGSMELASVLYGCTVDEAVRLYAEAPEEARACLEAALALSMPRRERPAAGNG